MIEIKDLYRDLFPDLAKDLEENGQLEPILVDEDGYVHDGMKRVLLCGLDQLEKKIVPRDSKCSNVLLSNKQKRPFFIAVYNELVANATFGSKDKLTITLAERYGIHRATAYRWVGLEYPSVTRSKQEPSVFNQYIYPAMKLLQECPSKVSISNVVKEGNTLQDAISGNTDIHWICEVTYNFMNDLINTRNNIRTRTMRKYLEKHGVKIAEEESKPTIVEKEISNSQKVSDLIEWLSGEVNLSSEEKEVLVRLLQVVNDPYVKAAIGVQDHE